MPLGNCRPCMKPTRAFLIRDGGLDIRPQGVLRRQNRWSGRSALARLALRSLVFSTALFAVSVAAQRSAAPTPRDVADRPLRWLVQPLGEARTFGERIEELLERRLAVGKPVRPIRFELTTGALAHWNRTRVEPDYGVALDDAHFSAYRARRFGFRPILTMGRGISYTVVMPAGEALVDKADLKGLRIAARPAPGLAALRLLALFGPTETPPEIVATRDERSALDLLGQGRVSGALIEATGQLRNVESMLVLDEVPGPVLSVSGRLDDREVQALRETLLGLGPLLESEAYRRAGLAPFRPLERAEAYRHLDQLLRTTWGFESADLD